MAVDRVRLHDREVFNGLEQRRNSMTTKRSAALLIAGAGLAAMFSIAAPVASADDVNKKDCDMTYTLKGWSAVYKTAKGEGTISCSNGQQAQVEISVHGGGLTFGKSEIYNGKAEISGVKSIDDIFGSYAAASAHAGVVKAGAVEVMTKGTVSLALAGTGAGVDAGIDFSKFEIRKLGAKKSD
jgi:hypothetical protein